MRGKVVTTMDGSAHRRITPAYAGKSFKFFRRGFSIWDHPRLCGEKLSALCSNDSRLGSPPPMRGKASSVAADTMIDGITPAYAGKSSNSS